MAGEFLPGKNLLFDKYQGDFRFAPSQWETSLQSNAVSHWVDVNLESALNTFSNATNFIELTSFDD